jgi:hypothetical protein
LILRLNGPEAAAGQIQGIIDEVGVFRVGLTDKDIKRIMEDGLDSFATAVKPGGKLYATWGALRSGH